MNVSPDRDQQPVGSCTMSRGGIKERERESVREGEKDGETRDGTQADM